MGSVRVLQRRRTVEVGQFCKELGIAISGPDWPGVHGPSRDLGLEMTIKALA